MSTPPQLSQQIEAERLIDDLWKKIGQDVEAIKPSEFILVPCSCPYIACYFFLRYAFFHWRVFFSFFSTLFCFLLLVLFSSSTIVKKRQSELETAKFTISSYKKNNEER